MTWKGRTHGRLAVTMSGSGDTIAASVHQTVLAVVPKLCIPTMGIIQVTWEVHTGPLHQ